MCLYVGERLFGEAERRHLGRTGFSSHHQDGWRVDGDWDVDVPSFVIRQLTPVPLSRRNIRLFHEKGPRHARLTLSPFREVRRGAAFRDAKSPKSYKHRKLQSLKKKKNGRCRSPPLLPPLPHLSPRFREPCISCVTPHTPLCQRAFPSSSGAKTKIGESVSASGQVSPLRCATRTGKSRLSPKAP